MNKNIATDSFMRTVS